MDDRIKGMTVEQLAEKGVPKMLAELAKEACDLLLRVPAAA